MALTEFVWVFWHLRSVMYDIYKNGVVHDTTTRSNCWIILWKSDHQIQIKFYGLHNRPSERTIGRIVQKFQDTGSVEDKKREKYSRSGRSLEHIVCRRCNWSVLLWKCCWWSCRSTRIIHNRFLNWMMELFVSLVR